MKTASYGCNHQKPKPPFPKQHQPKPGIESELEPKPRYQAPQYRPAEKLKDKVALITGGDSGIGRAVAAMYAREGADVAIVYLPVEQRDAEETRAAVEKAGRRALLIPGDVSDPTFCRSSVDATVTPEEISHFGEGTPLKRPAQPEEAAPA